MYDPLVVDAFMAAYEELAPLATEAGLQARSLIGEGTFSSEPDSALNEIRANASEVAILEQGAHQITTATSADAAMDAALQTLRQLTPITTCAFYRYDQGLDRVVCQHAAGDPHNLLVGLIIHIGERVTGWCAANQKAAMNSDAYLDLTQTASRFSPALRSTICVPLMHDEQVSGVFTGYSTQNSPFDERHRYVVERVAGMLDARLTPPARSASNVRSFPASRHH
jgi:putative methionine-R-sulfoxide reductase with GAF domain